MQLTHHAAHGLRRMALGWCNGVTHHPLRQLRLRRLLCLGLRHQFAAAQHRNAMRDAQHLAQLVADEDDGQAFGYHLRQHLEQRFTLLRREHGRGLIQDQDACAAVQRLEDFHALAFAHGQAAHFGVFIHAQSKALRHVLQLGARCGAPGEGLPQRLRAHHHVVQHAQVVGQREVLVHHANAGSQRRFRVARRQRLAEDFDVARVGRVVPEQDRHQRGLSGAVLTQQRQHLAALELQRDVVVGHESAEALGDMREFEGSVGHGGGLRWSKKDTPAWGCLFSSS